MRREVFMKKNFIRIMVSLLIFAVSGCGKKVHRIEVTKQIDLSGKWNDTDSQLVSEEMISDCLSRPWISQFQTETGEKPIVIVGTVINKTDEHIISETFIKDLERAFINSGRVQMVASRQEREELREEKIDMQKGFTSAKTVKSLAEETGADFMLKGVINSIQDKDGRKKVIYYQIDLELINIETNQKVWIGDKKIKKYIKK